MHSIALRSRNDFDEWRGFARRLLLDVVPPEEVAWLEPGLAADLFDTTPEAPPPVTNRAVGIVPPRFIALGRDAICHSDPERFALLYRLLWRLQRDRHLLELRSDPDVGKLDRRVAAVRRDGHKMRAFVRFRAVRAEDETERFLAWFQPDHYVLEREAPFFADRFAGMNWGIVTPYRSAFWDGQALCFGDGGRKADVPSEDAVEAAWLTYYASIFNPARLKVAMMQSEMPKKYWRNLPEAALIAPLIRNARSAEEAMIERQATTPPERHARHLARQMADVAPDAALDSLPAARKAAATCTRCPLYEHATQTVFGEGSGEATLMFVGEQPGDQEDLAGKPFVGPAGQVFDEALKTAGIDRRTTYVTNAVKHFKFEPRGKRRIHQKPNAGEIRACRFWLDLERDLVKPQLIVAMGATAVSSLIGRTTAVTALRGKATLLDDGTPMWVTVHPSFLLRMPDRELAKLERRRFEEDSRSAREYLESLGQGAAPARRA